MRREYPKNIHLVFGISNYPQLILVHYEFCIVSLIKYYSCYRSSTLSRDSIHEGFIVQCIEGLTNVPTEKLVKGLKAFLEK